jgi:hypothetical protein
MMAERVGFEPSRDELKASRAMPYKHTRTDKTERSEGLAERVGFEPYPTIENKELNGFSLPRDPHDPHKSPRRDTY